MEVQFDEEAFRKPAKKINNFDSRCTRSFAAPARSLHPLVRCTRSFAILMLRNSLIKIVRAL